MTVKVIDWKYDPLSYFQFDYTSRALLEACTGFQAGFPLYGGFCVSVAVAVGVAVDVSVAVAVTVCVAVAVAVAVAVKVNVGETAVVGGALVNVAVGG